jgi:hypothetical protein
VNPSPNKRILLLLVAVALLVVGAGVGYDRFRAAPSEPPRIAVTPAEFDFGEIGPKLAVSHVFTVTNTGGAPLDISGVSTSCGCTTAAIETTQLQPGESTALTVIFDPQAHNGATGRFLRLVYLRSNDPQTPEAQMKLQVTVTDKS